jgi:hypothetical protein
MNTTVDPELDQRQAAGFRRAIWLQVYLPLLAGVLLIVLLVAWGLAAGGRGEASTGTMADVALVALLLPVMLLGVIVLAAVILLMVGIGKAIDWLPPRVRVVQQVVARAPVISDRIAGRAAQVVVAPRSVWAAIRAAARRLTGRD